MSVRDNDNDNDHSISQLSVHEALTCPEKPGCVGRRVRCLSDLCWFGCGCRSDRGRGSCCLLEFAAYKVAFHGVPFRAILCHGEPGRVLLLSLLILVGCRNALRSSFHLFLASGALSAWFMSLNSSYNEALSSDIRVNGNHSCLLPVYTALFEYPRRDPI